ncbi:MAG: thioredoxin family protein [Balneolaceae bacterium]|nr:thioredoxin family protein [Balneolaceae bacterium]MBO6545808.1 thioredoxin family protein [Balneolaceae bacterium]MBO6647204.1 thioredoxin family protein [Balneolaceae bacterium]
MKRTFFFILFLMMLFTSISSIAQTPDIIGPTTAEEVRTQHRVFDIYTKRYSPNPEAIKYLSEIQDSVTIHVLFGTWCHDSKKQIPAFIKTLEEANNAKIKVEYIAVSRKKAEPSDLVERWDLKLTPTFIIVRRNKEYGRIIEEPISSLEEDLVVILKSGPNSDQ